MCARDFIKALPKCEQHLHVEGTLEPAHAFSLAEKNKMKLPASHFTTIEAAEERYKHFTSLDDFLGYYNAAMAVLLHEEDFTELGSAYFDRVHADGLVHAEIFVDPQAHTERGVSLQAVFGGLKKAQQRAEEKYGITSILSACFVRHLSVESAMSMVDAMQPWVADGTVVGLGCDSTELNNPPDKYACVYQRARDHGMKRFSMHSGEEGPAAWVKTTVEDLGITRIDHGVRSADDPEVLKYLAEQKAFLTVCPVSNVQLRVVEHVSQVPLQKFMDAGIPFSLNSDDPSYFGAYLLDVYLAVHDAFKFSKETWKKLMLDSYENSWASDERKVELRNLLDGVLEKYKNLEL